MLIFPGSSAFKLTFVAVLFALTSACGGSSSSSSEPADGAAGGSDSSGGNSSGGGEGGTDSGDQNTGNTAGAYDLSTYMFNSDVLTNNGRVEFLEKSFPKTDAADGFAVTLERSFVNNNGTIEEYSSGDLFKTFTIGTSQISETFIDPSDSRTSLRYAKLGDQYMDANSTPPPNSPVPFTQNASCVLEEHLDTFDLSTATGDVALASGVYDDVLRVQCITSFVNGSVKSPHTTLNSYFAKGIGVIFNEGNVFFLGDVYIVEEY